MVYFFLYSLFYILIKQQPKLFDCTVNPKHYVTLSTSNQIISLSKITLIKFPGL